MVPSQEMKGAPAARRALHLAAARSAGGSLGAAGGHRQRGALHLDHRSGRHAELTVHLFTVALRTFHGLAVEHQLLEGVMALGTGELVQGHRFPPKNQVRFRL